MSKPWKDEPTPLTDAASFAGFPGCTSATDHARDLERRLRNAERLLTRYYNETPIGHHPHMIAHEVDAHLTAAKENGQ